MDTNNTTTKERFTVEAGDVIRLGYAVGATNDALVGQLLWDADTIVAALPVIEETPPLPVAATALPDPRMVTPSDRVLLKSIDWLPADIDGHERLQTVNLTRYAVQRAVTTAVMANLSAGVISVDTTDESAFFGLVRYRRAYLTRVKQVNPWPYGSFESAFAKDGRLADIVAAWIGKTVVDPESMVMEKLMHELVSRRLLTSRFVQTTAWWIFETTKEQYILPPETEALLKRRPEVETDTSWGRGPVAVDTIMAEVGAGFGRRRDCGD